MSRLPNAARAAALLLALVSLVSLCRAAVPQADFESRLFEPAMDRLFENRLVAESGDYLSLNLFNVPVDPTQARHPEHFVVMSTDDANYSPEKKVQPAASGSRTRVARVAIRKNLLLKGTVIFLKLPYPLQNGKTYGVQTSGLAGLPALAPVTFDDRRQVNDNLRVNQLGYLPGFAKRAYLGQYMGDLGAMPVGASSFELLDGQGKAAYTGKVQRRAVHEELVGQDVYELDFTPFERPGTYRLRVPGVGVSYAFEIGARALNPAFLNLMRGSYHQRCDMPIDAAYSRHHRPACHQDDAFLDASAEKTSFVQPKSPPLYPAAYTGSRHPAVHGHHDAGDYGKYTVTGAAYVFCILNALEAFPDRFRTDDLGLPYSGNGIPDLLDECKWELDWLEQMQDESDGGVFGVILPKNGGYEQFFPPEKSGRLFFPKDTVFTAAYAAALAHASRSPLIRKHYPVEADRYLAKARRAWRFLEKNQRYVQYFHYGAEFGDWDERCWAAVELYAATGEPAYHEYFLKNFEPERKRFGWSPLFEGVGYASEVYFFLSGRSRDPGMLGRCRQAVHDACAMHLEDGAAFPYRLSMPQPTIRYGNYGWVFPGDLAGYDLLMGYALEKDRRYLQCALDNLDYECGANPSGYFLQTGLGAKQNLEVVSDTSSWDGIIDPVPGLPLGVGSGEIYWLQKYDRKLGEGTYPEKWPLMNRWYDGFNVQTEFTMGPLIREALTAGFFADLARPLEHRPRVKIHLDRASGPPPLNVRCSFTIDLPGATVRQVFWDFGDERFSIRRSPTHDFSEPGREYPIAVTILTEDGVSAYDEARVRCVHPNPPYPTREVQPDASTLLLFHLNGDLKDASGHGVELKAATGRPVERRAYSFAAQPPGWMAQPAGSCLVLDGAEQFSVTLPRDALPDPADRPLTLEMMLYLTEFAGWSYPGDPLVLGLRNEWDSSLGWQQETWDRAEAPRFGKAIPGARFAQDFPRDRWCQVRITYDGRGHAQFFVDGKPWGASDGPFFRPGLKTPVVFTLGPFRGMVDEVRVSAG